MQSHFDEVSESSTQHRQELESLQAKLELSKLSVEETRKVALKKLEHANAKTVSLKVRLVGVISKMASNKAEREATLRVAAEAELVPLRDEDGDFDLSLERLRMFFRV